MRLRICRLGAALVMAAALFATSACTLRTHTAFEVDGSITTNDQVQAMADACGTVVTPFPWANMSALVSDMIHAMLAQEVAADNNLTFTEDELRMPIQTDKMGDQYKAMLNNDTCSALALGLTLEQAVKESIGESTYNTAAGLIAVSINPRFGTWNADTLTVDGSGSLSKADG